MMVAPDRLSELAVGELPLLPPPPPPPPAPLEPFEQPGPGALPGAMEEPVVMAEFGVGIELLLGMEDIEPPPITPLLAVDERHGPTSGRPVVLADPTDGAFPLPVEAPMATRPPPTLPVLLLGREPLPAVPAPLTMPLVFEPAPTLPLLVPLLMVLQLLLLLLLLLELFELWLLLPQPFWLSTDCTEGMPAVVASGRQVSTCTGSRGETRSEHRT